MSKSRGLGRGFDSLIPTEVTADMPVTRGVGGEAVQQLAPATIQPNPHQPRTHFDPAALQELADSIKTHGILQPLVVSQLGEGRYELIAGERRLRAAKLADLTTVPAIVRSFDAQQKLELALIENLQRSELNPIETAVAYRSLSDEFNLTLDQVSARVGKAKSTVANLMRLLALPVAAREAVAAGTISEAHGRAIVALDDPVAQETLLQHITTDGWTVRQAEQFVREHKSGPSAPERGKATYQAPEAHTELVRALGERLRAKVAIQPMAKGGRLVISFANDDELARIRDLIGPIGPA
jgi:ParB family chromosome partitioning protein